ITPLSCAPASASWRLLASFFSLGRSGSSGHFLLFPLGRRLWRRTRGTWCAMRWVDWRQSLVRRGADGSEPVQGVSDHRQDSAAQDGEGPHFDLVELFSHGDLQHRDAVVHPLEFLVDDLAKILQIGAQVLHVPAQIHDVGIYMLHMSLEARHTILELRRITFHFKPRFL